VLRAPVGRGLRVARRDAGNTPSPNGGFPMAMLAGVLGVRLEKADTYVLGAEGEPATAPTLTAARRLVSLAALFAGLAALLLTLLGRSTRNAWLPLGWPW
jgi:adenosylcobinamide-phosphate synthase